MPYHALISVQLMFSTRMRGTNPHLAYPAQDLGTLLGSPSGQSDNLDYSASQTRLPGEAHRIRLVLSVTTIPGRRKDWRPGPE